MDYEYSTRRRSVLRSHGAPVALMIVGVLSAAQNQAPPVAGAPKPATAPVPGAASAPAPAKRAAPAPKPATTASTVSKPATPAAKAESTPADKIIQMIQLKLPEGAILAAYPGLKLSPDELIQLKKSGASDELVTKFATGNSPPPTAVPAAAPASPAPAAEVAVAKTPAVSQLAPIDWNSDLSSLRCEAPGQRKRIIAVKNFDWGAAKTTEQTIIDNQGKIVVGMSALATKRIQEGGKFRVVERENIQAVLTEQDFGASSRVKKGSQARIGRVLGADAILLGTLTVFGRDDKKKSIGGIGGLPLGIGGLKVGWGENKAVVALNYRLVDAETSETLATGEARGESTRKSKGIEGLGIGAGGFGAGGFDMSSANFAETIIGEATIDCMNKLIQVLNDNESKVPLRFIDVDTRIADVSGKQIYISGGAADGVQKCDRFEVSKVLKEIRDPVTKDLLDLQLEKVGELMVTEVRDRLSIGLFNGSAAPAVGYAVRKFAPATSQKP